MYALREGNPDSWTMLSIVVSWSSLGMAVGKVRIDMVAGIRVDS